MTARWRLALTSWPRPGIELRDTPRPGCAWCGGTGGVTVAVYGHEEPDYDACDCWDPGRRHFVLRLPDRLMPRWYRRPPAGCSDEPPF